MNVKEFVDDVLCVPVTRVGNRYVTEAIELILDTRDHKFYPRMAEIAQVTPKNLEKALRDAKTLGLEYMSKADKNSIFGESTPTASEYIIKSAEYFRRTYENKD